MLLLVSRSIRSWISSSPVKARVSHFVETNPTSDLEDVKSTTSDDVIAISSSLADIQKSKVTKGAIEGNDDGDEEEEENWDEWDRLMAEVVVDDDESDVEDR